MPRRTIAVISVSAGAGHVRAAEALRATAELRFPEERVIHVDLMEFVPPLFRRLYADSYLGIVERHPALWGYLYEKADKRKIDSATDRLRTEVERLNTKKFKDFMVQSNPDAVICTHFLPAELLSRWRRRKAFTMPVWVVITDFDVHMLWVQRHVTGYCVASDEVAWRLQDRGVRPDAIRVTGIPIMPAFRERIPRSACARAAGADPGRTIILLMSGAAGVVGIHKLAPRLLGLPGDFQIIALAGRNKKVLDALSSLAREAQGRLIPMGFTTTPERLMFASDFAITKPGGLTTSECLAVGLPMVIVSPIPGQEERNADYLLEQGAALKAYDAAGVEFRVKALTGNRQQLDSMRARALKISTPDAAEKILRLVLEGLP